jgi:hypothetical protein
MEQYQQQLQEKVNIIEQVKQQEQQQQLLFFEEQTKDKVDKAEYQKL